MKERKIKLNARVKKRDVAYVYLLAIVAAELHVPVESLTPKTEVPEKSFNKFVAKEAIKKRGWEIDPKHGDRKYDWKEDMTIRDILDHYWPKGKKKPL